MAKLYITSPINNDTLYRPITLDTNTTSSHLADSLDNHHGETQVILAEETNTDNHHDNTQVLLAEENDTDNHHGNTQVLLAEENDTDNHHGNTQVKAEETSTEVVKTDTTDKEVIIATDNTDKEVIIATDNTNKEVITAANTQIKVVPANKTNDEVLISDKTDKEVSIADKNDSTPAMVEGCSVDRDNSIEYVKTVSVSPSLSNNDNIQKLDDAPENLSEKVEIKQQVSDQSVVSDLSVEKSNIPIVKLSEKSNEEPKSSSHNPLLPSSSTCQSDAMTAAAEKLNEVLLSESSSVTPLSSTQQKINVSNNNISDIVVIPDESPTHLEPKSSSHTLPSQSRSSISVPSQNPIVQSQPNINLPSSTFQKPEQTVSNSHSVSVITSNTGNSPAVPHMTTLQQSFIQKLIPSLINLNKPDNVANSSAPNAPTAPTAPSIPALIPAAQSLNTVTSTVGQSTGTVRSGVLGSGQSGVGVSSAKSNGVITIDDDDDLVVTQVIKPAAPAATPNPPPVSRNDSLLQLVSKIKSMVDPNAASQPKLKQLQQTLASLIKNQGQSRNMTTNPQQQQQVSTAATTQRTSNFQQQQQQQVQVSSQVQQRLQQQQQQILQPSSFRAGYQDVQHNVSTTQRQGLQPQQIPQRQLQALLQQAIANRTQAQQQAVQQHVLPLSKPHSSNQQQQQRASAHIASSSTSAAGLGGNSSNVVQQLLQQQQQQQQQVLKQQLLSQKQRPSSSTSHQNHSSTSTSQNQNQHLMLIENALKGSNPNLAANLKTLQDQLKAKSSNPADIKNELTAIISNVLRLRNSQQQMESTSPKPLKSPSLRRQIQTAAHRPKLNTSPYHNKPGPSHNIQQLRKPVRAPTIDILQNLPVVHHSKEKVQFLSVVGLITRQEHQKLILSHANRKRRIEEARNILQLEKVSFERKRKRPRKDDMDNDGDTHDNYCSKCRMAGELLMCDKCPRVYHLFCLDPPLKQVPDGEWFCSKCQEEKDVEESMDVNVIDVMEDPAVDPESRGQIEELHRKLMEAKRVRLDLENTTDIT